MQTNLREKKREQIMLFNLQFITSSMMGDAKPGLFRMD